MSYANEGSGDVRRHKGIPRCRLRIGDWQVIFIEDAGSLTVVAIGHRREIYDEAANVMNVRFKKTNKGELASLPRKEYEALAAKAQEADEDFGTARLIARVRKEIANGMPLIPKQVVDGIGCGGHVLRVLREWRGSNPALHFAQD